MKMKRETFKYKGFTFRPYRKLTQEERDKAITPNCTLGLSSDRELNLTTYSRTYTHGSFYAASGNSDKDLFVCLETGRVYVPGSNELFLCENIIYVHIQHKPKRT